MPHFPRDELEGSIKFIEAQVHDLQRLKELNIFGGKVVNFGCTSEYEPVALMWTLNTNEVVGININIVQAQQKCSYLKLLLNIAMEAYRSSFVTRDDRLWWESQIPDFLRKGAFPKLVNGDMLHTPLLSNYFDLAYCSGVLKHVICVRDAIEEMRRIVKFGGWIVTGGPETSETEEIFKQVGFKSSKVESGEQLRFYEKVKL